VVLAGFRIDMGNYQFRTAQAPAGEPARKAETDSFKLGSADHLAENLAPAVAVDVDGGPNDAVPGWYRVGQLGASRRCSTRPRRYGRLD
jgi:hypothetical protein